MIDDGKDDEFTQKENLRRLFYLTLIKKQIG